MSGQRWKAVERAVADALNEHLAAPNFTPIERIPLLGREGPDLTVNEIGLVINVKSRAEIPGRLFPKQNELMFIGALVCFRLEDTVPMTGKGLCQADWMPAKPWKRLNDWWLWMDKWTKQNRRECITSIIIHRPRMPIGHAGVVIHQNDLRRLSCQIKMH